jgi:hypothetical protein
VNQNTTRTLDQEQFNRIHKNMDVNRELMWAHKLQPCADCKMRWHPSVMTFDHIDRKTVEAGKAFKSLNALLGSNPILFKRQLFACSVVCLNCHRIREVARDLADPKVSKRDKYKIAEYLSRITMGALIEDRVK